MSKIDEIRAVLKNNVCLKKRIAKELNYSLSWVYHVFKYDINITAEKILSIERVIRQYEAEFSKRVDLPPVNEERYMRLYNGSLLALMTNGKSSDELINEQERVQKFINENYLQ